MKNEKFRKKNTIFIITVIMALLVLVVGKSYAEYKQETEVLFMNAKVGEFKSNDIELAMKLDGEEVSNPPSKDNYQVEVSCDKAVGRWDMEEWGAMITNITAGKVKCEVKFLTPKPTLSEITTIRYTTAIKLNYESKGVNIKTICKYGTSEGEYTNEVEGNNTECSIEGLEKETLYYYQVCAINSGGKECKTGNVSTKGGTIAENVEIGDYISMTPTATSYTYGDTIINPSELNLWRVIKLNEDGTVEIVSDKISNSQVTFGNLNGYITIVGELNEIAAQYTNEKYVEKTRHMGYVDQPLVCEGSVTCYTVTNCGSDTGYETDYNLVNAVYGNVGASSQDGLSSSYWLASRLWQDNDRWRYFYGRFISADGSLGSNEFSGERRGGGSSTKYGTHSIRPILTLKASTKVINGVGTLQSPYQLL